MGKKKKLKYGFHYTWKDILPRSEIVVVHATDLEEARTLVRAKVKELYPDVTPGCHWITMPEDFDRKPPRGQLAADAQAAETQQIRQQCIWRTHLKGIILVGLLGLLIILLTSCSDTQCNTSLNRFTKKLNNWTDERFGIQRYYLLPEPPYGHPRFPPTRPPEE